MLGESTAGVKDFASDREIRWCVGCGDYGIIRALRSSLGELGADRDETVIISGIGCASRMVYYMSTYGLHTIHGRASSVATGLKLVREDLDIWIISGDGDALSIGGNHLLHLLRRDIDCQFLLCNNETYGLTKGQTSPTSRIGTISSSSPQGSKDRGVNAVLYALGSGGRFVARGVDVHQQELRDIIKESYRHKGTSFVEILQNCIIYNDKVFSAETDKKSREDNTVYLRHGEIIEFGSEGRRYGLKLDRQGFSFSKVLLSEGDSDREGSSAELLRHDETNLALAMELGRMEPPTLPRALGVIYRSAEGASDGTSNGESGQGGVQTKRRKPNYKKAYELLREGNIRVVD